MARKIYCNKCGRSFDMFDEAGEFHFTGGLGYGSAYDGDGFEIDLCIRCVDELVKSCKISPLISQKCYTEVADEG